MSPRPTPRAGGGRGAGRRQPPRRSKPDVPGGNGLGGTQVEGRQAVRELLVAGRRRVHQVWVASGHSVSEALEDIVDLAADRQVPVRRVDRDEIDTRAGTEAPQGVVAQADPVRERELEELVTGRPFLVVLDGVTDPHNLGAVMRSALCAGASGLIVARHRSAWLTPAALKAAAGAAEYLPMASVAGIPAALSSLRQAGVWTVGLDAGADRPIWGLELATEPVALVVGAEGRGLSPLVLARCEMTASIPMAGPLDSLNVAAAATLACFEVARVRGRSLP